MRFRIALALALLGAATVSAEPPRRRALLIGINDYTASRIAPIGPPAERDWPNLTGPVNDVHALAEMLVVVYGFNREDIVTLTDQAATREAILRALENHLVKPASKDDILLFYFAGHGSQVRNSRSDEPDKLDESIVPADSRRGARDIRDKELRPLFNRILDRDARLTIVLDNCHSGSGARGLPTGARPRGVKADLRDVADRTYAGPRPEDRGALVLSASHDFDSAWETRDPQGNFHGTFTWALLRSLRDAPLGEAAIETFLRAQARMRAETPYQEPVIAGDADARVAPFLGVRTDRDADRIVVAVEKARADGTVMLLGGWANGLSVGSELRLIDSASSPRFKITAIEGLGRSLASGPSTPPPGTLLEVVGWAAPPVRPMCVWMPRAQRTVQQLTTLAKSLQAVAKQSGVHWISDPTISNATHLLRYAPSGWELLGADGEVEQLGSEANAIAAVAKLPSGSSLFVQFPAPSSMVLNGIDATDRPEEADYILAGRYAQNRLAYAWVRPAFRKSDRRTTGLPRRSLWVSDGTRRNSQRNCAPLLSDAVRRLRKIHAWSLLDSPPRMAFQYRLRLRRVSNDMLISDGSVIGDEDYQPVLHTQVTPLPAGVPPRYVYVFAIDSYGGSTLLYPRSGSVENRFPLDASHPPIEIPLGKPIRVTRPYGIDTYYLLTTDEPLPNPWILEWDGVRTRLPESLTPLEQLLSAMQSGTRGGMFVTRTKWSIERVIVESLAPRGAIAGGE